MSEAHPNPYRATLDQQITLEALDDNPDRYYSIGHIRVEPPIRVGAAFGKVVLGRVREGMKLTEIMTTHEATVLEVQMPLVRSQAEQQALMERIAARVEQFACNPDLAMSLRKEDVSVDTPPDSVHDTFYDKY